jgi:4-hydroxy-2-oxoheptanedioate aldolase
MRLDLVTNFRKRLAEGCVYGPFCKTGDPAFIEALGYSGFDFVILDMEHGPTNVESLQNLVRAAELSAVLPIVRVKEGAPWVVGAALDVGACGIQAPQITDAAAAEEIVRLAKFAPRGERGVCRFVRSAKYSSQDRFEYFRESNDAVVVLQLEGQEAMERLDEILAVDGVDIVFIGPYDLSQSLGVPGETTHPKVLETMRSIVELAVARGLVVGTFVDTVEQAKMWREAGVRYLSYSVDLGIFTDACRTLLQQLRE